MSEGLKDSSEHEQAQASKRGGGCPTHGNIEGEVGQGSEQHDLHEGDGLGGL